MVELNAELEVDVVRANLERVREQISATGRDPESVQILVAIKYVAAEQLPVLAQAGVELVGENRAQDLIAKQADHEQRFTWDFIGHLQSRKVRQLVGRVRYIHSVASDSTLSALRRHGGPDTEVMVEVNVAREAGKSGIEPPDLTAFLERCPVRVVGLMTMPPQTRNPEDSRRHFATLRELAGAHGLPHLSMGTSQDYLVAVQEGATVVRLGTVLYGSQPSDGS